MTAIYLWANALGYLALSIWCTVKAGAVAQALGYTALDDSGRIEFLTLYGGLQLGLALCFAWTAQAAQRHRTGLGLALLLYAPIALFRWVAIAWHWPVGSVSLGVGALEAALLVLALILWWRLPQARA